MKSAQELEASMTLLSPALEMSSSRISENKSDQLEFSNEVKSVDEGKFDANQGLVAASLEVNEDILNDTYGVKSSVDKCMHTECLPVEVIDVKEIKGDISVHLPTTNEIEKVTKKNSEAKEPTISSISEGGRNDEVVDISLIPEDENILSDYNILLTQNIELFQVSATKRIGLRCKDCGVQGHNTTAATFFPSSINSIASGIGTIGARHFIGGKCPSISTDTMNRLKQFKKTSQQQTRTRGRISLDAHCKEIAKRENLINHEIGGIFVCKDINQATMHRIKDSTQLRTNMPKVSSSSTLQSDSGTEVSEIDRDSSSAFVEGAVEHFWECKHCKHLPCQWRATGSVVFSHEKPTFEQVQKHLQHCQGKQPLLIPRDAVIDTKEHENATSVMIKWENMDKNIKKTSRLKRRSFATESDTKKRRKLSLPANLEVKKSVEDEVLVTEEDKVLTTDFAHFTVKQLKKCYLTKSGGSRGNCPLGFPGLACTHCVGTVTARRFFYTSADHLRNSFSHIPSHLAICSKCPESVKQKIAEFKTTRSKQKATKGFQSLFLKKKKIFFAFFPTRSFITIKQYVRQRKEGRWKVPFCH